MTEILHTAYGRLAVMGLNYQAVDQPVEVTRERAALGECYIAELTGEMVGTVTLMPPSFQDYHPHFSRPDVAMFGQFAMDPKLQGKGHGNRMIAFLEDRARALGAKELACDTAEPATHLVEWYTRLGYRYIDHADWPHTNYISLILSKVL
ncbi:MAG: GNAT family N-acetyltransferase [Alphaproteobacteria bacterium]|nr:GNAT family N-acetyltransferase [Alphaproteobacteria bacterium]